MWHGHVTHALIICKLRDNKMGGGCKKNWRFLPRVRGSEINAKRWNLQLESREEEECLIDQMFFGLETYN